MFTPLRRWYQDEQLLAFTLSVLPLKPRRVPCIILVILSFTTNFELVLSVLLNWSNEVELGDGKLATSTFSFFMSVILVAVLLLSLLAI
jgi:hypothetical protein